MAAGATSNLGKLPETSPQVSMWGPLGDSGDKPWRPDVSALEDKQALQEAWKGYMDRSQDQCQGDGLLGNDKVWPPPTPSPTPAWNSTEKRFTFPEPGACVAARQAPIGSEMQEFIRSNGETTDQLLKVQLPRSFDCEPPEEEATVSGSFEASDRFIEKFLYDFRMRYFYDQDFRVKFRKQMDLGFVCATNMAHVQEVLNDMSGQTNSVASYCQLVHRYLEDLYSMYNLVSMEEEDGDNAEDDVYRIPGTIPAFREGMNRPPAYFCAPGSAEAAAAGPSKEASLEVGSTNLFHAGHDETESGVHSGQEEGAGGDSSSEVSSSDSLPSTVNAEVDCDSARESESEIDDIIETTAKIAIEEAEDQDDEADEVMDVAMEKTKMDVEEAEPNSGASFADFMELLREVDLQTIFDRSESMAGPDKLKEFFLKLRGGVADGFGKPGGKISSGLI